MSPKKRTLNTAATRMIEAGLSEVDAMNRGGWKTRSIFEHYHIMQEKAQQDAARKMEARKLSYGIGYGAQEMVHNDEEGIPAMVSPSCLPS